LALSQLAKTQYRRKQRKSKAAWRRKRLAKIGSWQLRRSRQRNLWRQSGNGISEKRRKPSNKRRIKKIIGAAGARKSAGGEARRLAINDQYQWRNASANQPAAKLKKMAAQKSGENAL